MGLCFSVESALVATAKLILQDGQLAEFPHSVKVSYLLQNCPSSFICNSDSMEYDDCILAMQTEDEILPGQIYFVLPLSRLRIPLKPAEMAALAVKASLALVKCNKPMKGRNEEEMHRPSTDGDSLGGEIRKRRRSSSSLGSARIFAPSLTGIQE